MRKAKLDAVQILPNHPHLRIAATGGMLCAMNRLFAFLFALTFSAAASAQNYVPVNDCQGNCFLGEGR